MTKDDTERKHDSQLRKSAEQLAMSRQLHSRDDVDAMSAAEVRMLVHELRVHQIELEMQNDELRRTQEELALSRARYFDLYDLAPIGYLSVAEDGLIQEANLTIASLLGLNRNQLVKQRFDRFIHFEDQDVYYQHRRQLVETGERQLCEMRLTKRDAPPFWARVESSVVRDALGALRFNTVVSDVPERRRAETALREQKQVLSDILETTLSGYWVWNIAENTAYLSPAFKKMFGYEDDELPNLPETWQKLLFPEDLPNVLATFHRHVNSRSRERYSREIRCRHKDGSAVWVIRAGRIIEWDADGSPRRMVGCHVDITDRKRAEKERDSLHVQLAQAQKMEAIGTLAGGIAHDFNNILGGILGGLSLLELENDGDRFHADIHEMKDLVKRATNLTRSLLGFARRGKYDVRPLDLAQTVEKTSAMFGRTRKDIIIEQTVAPHLSAVQMDYSQLEQVLLNLFINAAQAMPNGGRMALSMADVVLADEEAQALEVTPGRFVKLVVADTGIGMDEATQARIFEPFFTTKDIGCGSGLGLASVYGIVKNHHGHIRVESALGMGAAFTLFLPATDALPDTTKPPSCIPQKDPTPISRGLILVVDDEEQLLNICAREITRLGHQVLTASGGKQALELLRQQGRAVTLVILDMTMPDMNGSQTYDAIQELLPGMKVLLCSGYSVDGQAQAILERGCNGFLQKPFDRASLAAAVAEALEQ